MSNLIELAIKEVSPQVNKTRFLLDLKYRQEIINRVLNSAEGKLKLLDKHSVILKRLRDNKPISPQLLYRYRQTRR